MKKIIGVCVFLMMTMPYAAVYAQQNEKFTISTYYPSSNAVYKTVRLKGQTTHPANASPGQIYYNISSDDVLYYNKSKNWISLSSSGSNGVWHLTPNNTFPGGTAVPGDIFYNNTTDSVVYRNDSEWCQMKITGHWREANYTPGSPGYYAVYLTNQSVAPKRHVAMNSYATNKRFDVFSELSVSNATEVEKVAVFSKYFTDQGTSQELDISAWAKGAYKSYLNITTLLSAPEGSLKLAVGNSSNKWRISIKAGGFYDYNSEVMNIANVRNETRPALPRICIGNNTTSYHLLVDSCSPSDTYASSPFGVRGVQNGNKTGIFNVNPGRRGADLMYGCVFKGNATYNDPYMRTNGTQNRNYAKFVQEYNGSTYWYCGDSVTGSGVIANTTAAWNYVRNARLWNHLGLWVGTVSSRDFKENFAPLDRQDILQKINELNVTRWNYKSQGRYSTHIGPVAEDFYELFKTGPAEDQLYAVDPIGVSLAGIKELIQKADAQDKQIEELEGRLAAVKAKLGR